MTFDEALLLASGIALGANSMILLFAFWSWRDARRDQAAARQTLRKTTADAYLSSFRLYRLRQRAGAPR
ncbi:hypothetical protein [Streptomyces shenzhenensis]|uniref:hypothetical protein n=1 Tax=Streptomyces shenzhenensis TaxID=943815 RepID=UPI0033D579A1